MENKRKFLFLTSFFCIVLSLQKSAYAQRYINLSGIWLGEGYACYGPVEDPEIVNIEHFESSVTVTKIEGDDCVTSGELTWRGVFDQNPFPVQVNVSDGPNSSSRFLIDGTANIVDNDTIMLSIPGSEDGSVTFYRAGGSEDDPCEDDEIIGQYDRLDPFYHRYELITDICSISSGGCSRESVFSTMISSARFIAPTSDTHAVRNCGYTNVNIDLIPGTDTVRTTVDQNGNSITNYTTPNHVFHPGRVTRTVIERDGKISVITFGEGTGVFPDINEFGAPGTWLTTGFSDVDEDLAVEVQQNLSN